jgi:hypothetical protein
MQKQLIADFNLRKKELREDEDFLESHATENKVDKGRVKIAISQTHNDCE